MLDVEVRCGGAEAWTRERKIEEEEEEEEGEDATSLCSACEAIHKLFDVHLICLRRVGRTPYTNISIKSAFLRGTCANLLPFPPEFAAAEQI